MGSTMARLFSLSLPKIILAIDRLARLLENFPFHFILGPFLKNPEATKLNPCGTKFSIYEDWAWYRYNKKPCK
jgi:hypothetical protein